MMKVALKSEAGVSVVGVGEILQLSGQYECFRRYQFQIEEIGDKKYIFSPSKFQFCARYNSLGKTFRGVKRALLKFGVIIKLSESVWMYILRQEQKFKGFDEVRLNLEEFSVFEYQFREPVQINNILGLFGENMRQKFVKQGINVFKSISDVIRQRIQIDLVIVQSIDKVSPLIPYAVLNSIVLGYSLTNLHKESFKVKIYNRDILCTKQSKQMAQKALEAAISIKRKIVTNSVIENDLNQYITTQSNSKLILFPNETFYILFDS